MENQATTSQEKKASPFETLNRDELEKKCKNLLVIAQKAKQAKDEISKENKDLKEKLEKYETQKAADKECIKAMQAKVERLTEHNFTATTKIADMEKFVKKLEGQIEDYKTQLLNFDDVKIENESLKRQVARLSDENDSVISDMSNMEKAFEELKLSKTEDKELKSAHLEIEKLKNEIKSLQIIHNDLADKNSAKFKKMIQENTELKAKLEEFQNENSNELQVKNEKLMRKLKLYRDKVHEFSTKLKVLKNDRDVLLVTAREYSEVIPKWQNELANVSKTLIEKLLKRETENKELVGKIELLEKSAEKPENSEENSSEFKELLEARNSEIEKLKTSNEEIQKSFESEKIVVDQLNTEIQELKTFNENLKLEKSELIEKLENIMKTCQENIQEISKQQTVIADKETEVEKLRKQLENSEKSLKNQMSLLEEEQQRHFDDQIEEMQNQLMNSAQIYREIQENMNEKDNRIQELEESLQLFDEIQEKLAMSEKQFSDTCKLNDELKSKLTEAENQVKALKDQLEDRESAKETKEELNEKIKMLEDEKKELELKIQTSSAEAFETAGKLEYAERDRLILKQELTQLEEKMLTTAKEFEEKSEKLLQCEKDLIENVEKVKSLEEDNKKLQLFKTENTELLNELKEINEILKERGEIINKQVTRISELEAKLKDYENNQESFVQKLKEKDEKLMQANERIQRLDEENRNFKDKYNSSFDLANDSMSTSTISRADELMRLKELDDNQQEEKYNKLKALAIKLKKKIAEQQTIIQKLESTSSDNKNVQVMQQENDKLQDEIDLLQKKVTELTELVEQLQKNDTNKKEKQTYGNAIKEYQTQLQAMKKEKEAFDLVKQGLEANIQKLENSVKNKDKQLNDEMEVQKQLKTELDKAKLAIKKTSVLSLEMDAYEKSLGELNKKLEAKKLQVTELEETINTQDETMTSLKNQIRVLEESLDSEKIHSKEIKQQMDIQQNKLRESEHDRTELGIRHELLSKDHEALRLEIDEMKIEMTKTIAEKEKQCGILEADREKLMKQVLYLENDLERMRKSLKEYEKEIEDVKTEFASYKVRAQSVLRQNQNKDSGKEQELMEELQCLQQTLDSHNEKMKTLTKEHETLQRHHNELADDKQRLQARCKELLDLIEELRLQNEQVLDESTKRNQDHQDSIKTYQLQVDTLNNCYKKQIQEMEEKYNKEILELQEKLRVKRIDTQITQTLQQNSPPLSSQSPLEQKINMILMEREEGEGSENTSQSSFHMRRKISNSNSRRRDLVPLDELLNSTFDESFNPVVLEERPHSISPTLELEQTKEKLTKEEGRVKHLSALLSETERDLAKLQQLNEVLKEELRRQQRNIDREEHIQNSEYLKNVIIKFVTLNNGDERLRLVPVLNTILKLSPEETQKLTTVATPGILGRFW